MERVEAMVFLRLAERKKKKKKKKRDVARFLGGREMVFLCAQQNTGLHDQKNVATANRLGRCRGLIEKRKKISSPDRECGTAGGV